jgi:hypothetical protein
MTSADSDSERDPPSVTALLTRIGEGDSQAQEDLLPLVYVELRRLAHHAFQREQPGHTLQPTALVHEAFFGCSMDRGSPPLRIAHISSVLPPG